MGLKCGFWVAEERSDWHVFDLTWLHGLLPGVSFFGARKKDVNFSCFGQRRSSESDTLGKRARDIGLSGLNRGNPVSGACECPFESLSVRKPGSRVSVCPHPEKNSVEGTWCIEKSALRFLQSMARRIPGCLQTEESGCFDFALHEMVSNERLV